METNREKVSERDGRRERDKGAGKMKESEENKSY